MEKKINYLSRDFESIKSELIKFSKKYYPELSDSFNDSSVGAWFIDLISAVGDDLSYHTDRMYQETNVNSANMKSSVLNMARLNGVKIPGSKCSICEVELTVTLPTNSGNISIPNWDAAPLIKRGGVVGNSSVNFELTEDVDFGSQFNSNGVSNRKYTPLRDGNGMIIGYQVTKTVLVSSSQTRIFKKVLGENDVVPFMEVILPELNICNVQSILFKEDGSLNSEPQLSEFFIDEEKFKIENQDIETYRYFEVDSLADQYIFANETNIEGGITDIVNPQVHEDYTEGDSGNTRTMRYFKGKWKPIKQKFITEYTDNNYLKIIFGCGTDISDNISDSTPYTQYVASKIINNDLLGILPKVGWVMYVLYNVGGGIDANLGVGAINKIINVNTIFHNESIDNTTKYSITQSLSVKNKISAVGGKDAPSVDEIKYLTKYSVNSQKRCVTLKDYKVQLMSIPSRYGCPFRCNVVEDNNKISISVLTIDNKGKISTFVPQIMAENMVEYLSHYKMLTDYVEIRSGKVYNLGFEIDVFIDKNYITNDVLNSIIGIVEGYLDINKHDMGDDIFLGDLDKEITKIDGVISLINMRVYNLYGNGYGIESPLPKKTNNGTCGNETTSSFNSSESFEIDIDIMDYMLCNDVDSMFEIKNPSSDIKVRFKLR